MVDDFTVRRTFSPNAASAVLVQKRLFCTPERHFVKSMPRRRNHTKKPNVLESPYIDRRYGRLRNLEKTSGASTLIIVFRLHKFDGDGTVTRFTGKTYK